jgi:hypothetical protein
LDLAITRYFGCTIEELFGWRVDDDGKRRPLLAVDPKTGQARRLSERDKKDEAMSLVRQKLEEKRVAVAGEDC